MTTPNDSIIWKPVVDFEGIYEVSNMGDVRRVRKPLKGGVGAIGKVLKPHLNHDGYARLYLYKDGRQYNIFIHRIVMTAFVGPIPEGYETNHKDGNRANNRLDNLEYLTHGDNIRYAYQVMNRKVKGLVGEANPASKLKVEQVREIKRLLASKEYMQRDIADLFDVGVWVVCSINRGATWAHVA